MATEFYCTKCEHVLSSDEVAALHLPERPERNSERRAHIVNDGGRAERDRFESYRHWFNYGMVMAQCPECGTKGGPTASVLSTRTYVPPPPPPPEPLTFMEELAEALEQ